MDHLDEFREIQCFGFMRRTKTLGQGSSIRSVVQRSATLTRNQFPFYFEKTAVLWAASSDSQTKIVLQYGSCACEMDGRKGNSNNLEYGNGLIVFIARGQKPCPAVIIQFVSCSPSQVLVNMTAICRNAYTVKRTNRTSSITF